MYDFGSYLELGLNNLYNADLSFLATGAVVGRLLSCGLWYSHFCAAYP